LYHCHIRFYFVGHSQDALWTLRGLPPPEHFTFSFDQSDTPQPDLAGEADVILADLEGQEPGALAALGFYMGPRAELIVISPRAGELMEDPPACVSDIWPPLSEKALQFRFRKWLEAYRLRLDLRESRHFLDAVTNGSPNLIWFKDLDGVHRQVNDSFCTAVGKTREQVVGRKHACIWDVDEEEGASSVCESSETEVILRRKTCVFDEFVHTGSGVRQLQTYKSPLFDLDGSVMGTVGVALDVTRERAYEREVLEKNQTLELLFSTMNCGVICHSRDGKRIISINQEALNLLGYRTREELLADGFDQMARSVLDEDKPKLRESIQALEHAGDSVSVEYRIRHRDGTLLYILGNIKLIEQNGELLFRRFFLDYTAQKLREEEKLAQIGQEKLYQEQMFETLSTFLSDNIDDVYIMLSGDCARAEYISPNVERVLGVPRARLMASLVNVDTSRYFPGQVINNDYIARMQPGDALKPIDTVRVNPRTGEKKHFRKTVYCVSVQGQKKIAVYISDRTREQKVQDALSEALNLAQVANKAKSTFLSNVSHDIRTPMNAIMGFAALLKEEAGDKERVLEYTHRISAASEHLLGLINDVLDMNKIESGSAVLNIEELNLADIINELSTIIRPQARAKDQAFEIYTTALTCEHLLGDKLRINQIFINILSNAVKYTQTGGRIELRVEQLPQVDENYSRIRFTVSDNGQGMSKEYQQVIFDPFTREQSTLLNKIQGTGLGMAITKSLVDLMGGKITVDSERGKGSTFTVELELRIQNQEDDPAFWKQMQIAQILVADNDEELCRDIVRKLEASGVRAHYTTSGQQAAEMSRAAQEAGDPYDLILLDWKMPGLGGLETARLIRQNNAQKIPIVLFSAYDWSDIKEEAAKAGIGQFLPKPFFMTNFKEVIRRMRGAEQPGPGKERSVVQGTRIMVVDDIEVNRILLVKILTSLGAVCDTAEDGRQAVEKFEASQPGTYDIILMDVQMPVMNGYEATRAIRAGSHPSARSVAIIAMTANAFVDDIHNALESGMDAHVSKPVVLDQLKRTIQDVLEQKGQIKM